MAIEFIYKKYDKWYIYFVDGDTARLCCRRASYRTAKDWVAREFPEGDQPMDVAYAYSERYGHDPIKVGFSIVRHIYMTLIRDIRIVLLKTLI